MEKGAENGKVLQRDFFWLIYFGYFEAVKYQQLKPTLELDGTKYLITWYIHKTPGNPIFCIVMFLMIILEKA